MAPVQNICGLGRYAKGVLSHANGSTGVFGLFMRQNTRPINLTDVPH